MEITPDDLTRNELYKLITGTIVPRPIGWISTVNAAGDANLAPFSYFNGVCADPPHVLFCPGIRGTDGGIKDTLKNVKATGQFVVNIVSEDLIEAMNETAVEIAAVVDEFELVGVTKAASLTVRPPRVAESKVHFECEVVHIYEVGNQRGEGSVVVGRVLHFHIDDAVLLDNYRIDLDALQPIGRLVGSGYCRITDRITIDRPQSQITTTEE